MKFKIWNAFASNNSGSYTIVGSFASSELAQEIADELAVVVKDHTEWLDAAEAKGTYPYEGESPLETFKKKHRLGSKLDETGDYWPQYSDDLTPQVFAIEHKVVIHHKYTVTLPAVFGEYFYARDGRVETELNHAHHPVVGIFELYVPWQVKSEVDIPAKTAELVEALNAKDGVFERTIARGPYRPAWRSGDGFGDPTLTVGAIFEDLLTGFTAVARLANEHGMKTYVKVFESYSEADPLAFLRPSIPPLKRGLRRVILESPGHAPKDVVQVIQWLMNGIPYADARKILDSAPTVLLSHLVPEEAEAVSAQLRACGANASVSTE